MTYLLTPDFVSACNIDADIVPPPRTCASSFFNFSGNSTFYLLVKDALKNTEGKTFLPCLSIALEVFKYLLVEILLSLSLPTLFFSLSLSLSTYLNDKRIDVHCCRTHCPYCSCISPSNLLCYYCSSLGD